MSRRVSLRHVHCVQSVLLPLLVDIASGLELLHSRSIMHGGKAWGP
jgi:hypothetical protein